MAQLTYEPELTGVLIIDPYNDFISEGGKLWNRVKEIAESNNCVPNMLKVLHAGRQAKLRVFFRPIIATVRGTMRLGSTSPQRK